GRGGFSGVHEDSGGDVSGPVPESGVEHPSRVAARVPRRARGDGRVGCGGEGDGFDGPPGGFRCGHGADRGATGRGGRRGRRRREPARAGEGDRAGATGRSCGDTGSCGMHGEWTKGEFLVSERTAEGPRRPVRRALIGVSDKTGLLELATGLHAAGVEIVSTGGTARTIADAGVPVTGVEEVTGFPESFDGRVKTLHPRVHAGLLADTDSEDHQEQLRELDIAPFDLLVGNLYPFGRTVAPGAGAADCVEEIAIGGPARVRAGAKSHGNVAVVVAPEHYDWVMDQVHAGGTLLSARKRLAAGGCAHTAGYDAAVAAWFAESYAPVDEPGFGSYAGGA